MNIRVVQYEYLYAFVELVKFVLFKYLFLSVTIFARKSKNTYITSYSKFTVELFKVNEKTKKKYFYVNFNYSRKRLKYYHNCYNRIKYPIIALCKHVAQLKLLFHFYDYPLKNTKTSEVE